MSIPENLSKLMEICGKNDIEFRILKEEEESSVSFNEEEQILTVKFIGPDDSTLLSKIQNTIKTLEESDNKILLLTKINGIGKNKENKISYIFNQNLYK